MSTAEVFRAGIGAHEDASESCARLIDALRVADAPAEVLVAVRERLDAVSDLLAPFASPGPHSQSERVIEAQSFFARMRAAPHEVMPYSPIIGRLNPVSARLVFRARDGRLEGEGEIPVRFAGAPQTAHGGYVAAVLDELMGLVNFLNGEGGFTGTMTVRYHRPTPIERPLELSAEMVSCEGRKIRSRAEIHCEGELTASAEGLFVRPRVPIGRGDGVASGGA